MENRKLGILLITLSLIIGAILLYYNSTLLKQSEEIGCYTNKDCIPLEKGISITHIAVGIFSFILALGFYLLFFNKTEKAIMERLENEKNEKIDNAKFEMLMKALDSYEQKVLKAIKEQEGITQNTLRLRVDMSKAKLSYVLQELEKRGIIKRVEKGKTLAIYLKI
ncbi:MAG: winged helix-turn-helix transcriptional regulator [Nanoarchaeota archaeon]